MPAQRNSYKQLKLSTVVADGECTCKEGFDWIDSHPCPFAKEIHDNDMPCMCCPACTQECALNI